MLVGKFEEKVKNGKLTLPKAWKKYFSGDLFAVEGEDGQTFLYPTAENGGERIPLENGAFPWQGEGEYSFFGLIDHVELWRTEDYTALVEPSPFDL